jgi:hypothetical protein
VGPPTRVQISGTLYGNPVRATMGMLCNPPRLLDSAIQTIYVAAWHPPFKPSGPQRTELMAIARQSAERLGKATLESGQVATAMRLAAGNTAGRADTYVYILQLHAKSFDCTSCNTAAAGATVGPWAQVIILDAEKLQVLSTSVSQHPVNLGLIGQVAHLCEPCAPPLPSSSPPNPHTKAEGRPLFSFPLLTHTTGQIWIKRGIGGAYGWSFVVAGRNQLLGAQYAALSDNPSNRHALVLTGLRYAENGHRETIIAGDAWQIHSATWQTATGKQLRVTLHRTPHKAWPYIGDLVVIQIPGWRQPSGLILTRNAQGRIIQRIHLAKINVQANN